MSSENTNNQVKIDQNQEPALPADNTTIATTNDSKRGKGHGHRGGNGRRFNKDGEKREKDLTPEQKAKIQARKNINKTFDRKVNTKFCKFTPLRKFQSAKADGISVIINKGENKAKIIAVIVLTDLAKNKSTIRKESSLVEEIHNLPPYIKNQNLAEQITAKFYKGQGVILALPARPERKNRKERAEKDENQEKEKEDQSEASSSKFEDVDISHITEAAVEIKVKFE